MPILNNKQIFILDSRLEKTSFKLFDWPLSRVLLKNHADYPWLILVPRKPELKEITGLTLSESMQLMIEIKAASQMLQANFELDKLNIGSLGNIVSQFHFHVVGRFKSDPLWPHGIWQAEMKERAYDNPTTLIEMLKKANPNPQSSV